MNLKKIIYWISAACFFILANVMFIGNLGFKSPFVILIEAWFWCVLFYIWTADYIVKDKTQDPRVKIYDLFEEIKYNKEEEEKNE